MSGVPYVFGNATTSIPLSQLDVNFATNATIGTTSVGLGNTTTTLVGLTNVSTTVVNTSNVSANTSLLLQTNGTTTAVTIDTNQNVGVGVTPSAWGGTYKALDISTYTSVYGANGNTSGFSQNAYYNGTNWIYRNTNAASNYIQSGGTHVWQTAPSGTAGNAISFTQAMTLDASGNLGVGTTSPAAKLNVSGVAATGIQSLLLNGTTTAYNYATITNTTGNLRIGIEGNSGGIIMTGSSAYSSVICSAGNTNLHLGANATANVTIDTSGNLLVGQTTAGLLNGNGVSLNPAGNYSTFNHVSGTGSGTGYVVFGYAGGLIGSITQNGTTGVLYNLTSDYRLKNDQQALTGAKDFIMALKPKKWQWWDGSGEGVGFVAHEFMEVAKYSGHGEKDAVDADGKPVYQSIQPSSSEVMANLVSFIQEQQTLIESLTTRLAALEAK